MKKVIKQKIFLSFVYKSFKIQIINTGCFYPHVFEWILTPRTTVIMNKMKLKPGVKITDISSTDSVRFCKKDAKYFIDNIQTNARKNITFQKLLKGKFNYE